MHWPALARPQGRTIRGRRARTRALENRLAWNWTPRGRTHSGSRGRTRRSYRACRRSRPQGRLINRTRPSLRNDHSWQRHRRRRWCARGCRSGRHGRRLRRRRCGPHGRCNGCCRTGCRPRWHNRRCDGSWRRWCHRSRGLRRSWRRWSREGWPRARSWNYKFRRRGWRRCRRLRSRSGRRRRCGRGRRPGLDGRRWRRSICNRRSLLFADDGFKSVAGLGNMREVYLGLDFIAVGSSRPGGPAGTLCRTGSAEAGTHLIRFMVFERTGMALLLGDSNFGKYIENGLALDFQLSCQIVDSNLAHPPFRPPDCSAKSSYQPRVSFQVRAAASVCEKEPHLLLLLGRSRLLRGFSCFFLNNMPSIFFDGVGRGRCLSRFGSRFRRCLDLGRDLFACGCLFG